MAANMPEVSRVIIIFQLLFSSRSQELIQLNSSRCLSLCKPNRFAYFTTRSDDITALR